MKPSLDDLLNELRQADVRHRRLGEVEQLVRQRFEAGYGFLQTPRVRLSVQIGAVAGAFILGIVLGARGADGEAQPRAFLVEVMELLPPGMDGAFN